jgi:hypothetical protein
MLSAINSELSPRVFFGQGIFREHDEGVTSNY